MPLTEAECVAAIPKTGWVRRYIQHAFKQTSAPLAYHIGVGVTTLAVTCPIMYGMGFAGPLHTNCYTLLIGRSGEEQKSTALNIGREILVTGEPKLVGYFPGSPEGLLENMEALPSQLIPISEFGKFLSAAQRGYFEPIKTLLADLWDAGPVQRVRANKKLVKVDAPRLSITAACSIPYLEKHTLAEDWTGGFMGRWLVLYGRRERTDPDPVGDTTDVQWLCAELKRRANTPSAGWCMGLDGPASTLWNQWYTDVVNRRLPSNIVGIRARAPTLARKVALIYGWDFGPAQVAQPWKMSVNELEPAIALAELHVKSLVDLADSIAEHEDARLRREIIMAISEKGGTSTLGEILALVKRRKRVVVEFLDALSEEGRVKRLHTTLEGEKDSFALLY